VINPTNPTDSRMKKCLIIDDDTDDQEIFLMCLRKVNKHIDCKVASDGAEAVSLLQSTIEYTPDYIFIDLNMPKMNGIDCLKKIKSIERLSGTKMFMYSTTSEPHAISQSKDFGANEFIVKPVKTTDLKEKLFSIFNLVSEIDKPSSQP